MRLMQRRADNKRRLLRGIPLKCIIGVASMALRYGELSSRMLASFPPIALKVATRDSHTRKGWG